MRVAQGPVNILPCPVAGYQHGRVSAQSRSNRFIIRATADKLVRKEGDRQPPSPPCVLTSV